MLRVPACVAKFCALTGCFHALKIFVHAYDCFVQKRKAMYCAVTGKQCLPHAVASQLL